MDEVPFALRLTVWASALATLVLGVMPGLLLDVAGRWVLALGR
jgi:hypothetical protein